jgi:O-methyltransferase
MMNNTHGFIFKVYHKILMVLAAPVYLSYFFKKEVGIHYGVGFWEKVRMVLRFRRNTRKVITASSWLEHVQLAAYIFSVPAQAAGDVIECGCYKGGSTVNLSLVCGRVKRKLIVCDSFEGLPPCEERDKVHYNYLEQRKEHYEMGQFCGRLDEVKENIRNYGDIQSCEFVKGYFCDTLPGLNGKSYVAAFVDVDLHKSLEDCLISIWPRLRPGFRLFSHEAQDIALTSLFYNDEWWQKNLKEPAPGFVGAGTGLPLAIGTGSALGYALKIDRSAAKDWRVVNFSLPPTTPVAQD